MYWIYIICFANFSSTWYLCNYNNFMTNHKIMASSPITSWQIDGETVDTVSDLQMVTEAMKLKDTYSLEGKLWST